MAMHAFGWCLAWCCINRRKGARVSGPPAPRKSAGAIPHTHSAVVVSGPVEARSCDAPLPCSGCVVCYVRVFSQADRQHGARADTGVQVRPAPGVVVWARGHASEPRCRRPTLPNKRSFSATRVAPLGSLFGHNAAAEQSCSSKTTSESTKFDWTPRQTAESVRILVPLGPIPARFDLRNFLGCAAVSVCWDCNASLHSAA